MELPLAILVFGVLLVICLYGLAISSRRAAHNDASRRTPLGTQTVAPDLQRMGSARGPST